MSGSGLPETDPRRTGSHPVGTLLSVNVGMPKDVPWQRKTRSVAVSLFHEPAAERRTRISPLQVFNGDGSAAGATDPLASLFHGRLSPFATQRRREKLLFCRAFL